MARDLTALVSVIVKDVAYRVGQEGQQQKPTYPARGAFHGKINFRRAARNPFLIIDSLLSNHVNTSKRVFSLV